ncbi:MAG: DUF5979 domain-containing protein [Acidimicrobiia bacterium]
MHASLRARRWLGALAVPVVAAAGIATAVTFGTGAASADSAPNVTICHRTNSTSNPYSQITVDASSVDGNSGNDNGQGDHLSEHTGPVINWEDPPPPPHNGDQWGDIIPPVNGSAGLNWNAAGQAIFNADCNPGNASFVVTKVVAGTGAPAASQVYSLHVTCTIDFGGQAGATLVDEDVSLEGGASSAPYVLQAGAVCSVTENGIAALTNLVSATNDGPVTLAAVGGNYGITETNTFQAPGAPGVPDVPTQVARVGVNAGPVVSPAAAVAAAPAFTG